MSQYSNITSLRLEHWNENVVPSMNIISQMPNGSRIRLIGLDLNLNTIGEIENLYNTLDKFKGLDEQDRTIEEGASTAVSGNIYLNNSMTGSQKAQLMGRYPLINIDAQDIVSNVYFYNQIGNVLMYTCTNISKGQSASYGGITPTKPSTEQYVYSTSGWNFYPNCNAPSKGALLNIQGDRNVYAAFRENIRCYNVYWYSNGTGSKVLLQTNVNVPYGSNAYYTGNTPTPPVANHFNCWEPNGINIHGNTNCWAVFDMNDGYTYGWLAGTYNFKGEFTNSEMTTLKDYAFYNGTINKINCENLNYVGKYCFQNDYLLTSYNLPLVSNIEHNAFSNTRISTVNFPLLTSLNYGAFYNCTAINYIDLPMINNVRGSIFFNAFNLDYVSLPEVTDINNMAFWGNNNSIINYLSVPKLINLNGDQIFSNRIFSNSNILYFNTLKSINSNYCFSYIKGVNSLVLPELTTFNGESILRHSSIKTLNVPKTTYFYMNCLHGYLLENIYMPSATSFGNSMFMYCNNLKNITVRDLTSFYPNWATWYYYYENYTRAHANLIILNNESNLRVIPLSFGTNELLRLVDWIYVPDELYSDYISSTGWCDVMDRIYNLSEIEESEE